MKEILGNSSSMFQLVIFEDNQKNCVMDSNAVAVLQVAEKMQFTIHTFYS